MKTSWKFLLAVLVLFVLIVLNLYCGSVTIPAKEVTRVLTSWISTSHLPNSPWSLIILEHRFPQVVTALLCGCGLAISGLMLQTTFRNPLAGPSILGIDSGANLGVAIVMLFLGGTLTAGAFSLSGFFLMMIAALAGAWMMIVLLLLFARKLNSAVMLLIAGVMMSYLASSIISILNYGAAEEGIRSYMVWGLGSFSNVTTERLLPFTITMCIGILLALMLTKPLNALLLGEAYAANLGVNIKQTRTLLLLSTGLLTATSTAFCGPIAFIGLAVPHLARMFFNSSNHRLLLPATGLTGACLALLCNLISTLPSQGILPINVITPLLGVPVVVWVMLRKK